MSFLASMLTGGALGFGGGSQNTNTNSNFTGTTTGSSNTSGTGTTSRNLTPFQSNLQAPLFSYIQSLMTPGGATAAVAPFAAQARDAANTNYAGLGDSLRQQFLSTGGGKSGKYGLATLSGNLARMGALQNVDTNAATTAAQLPLTASALAEQLLGMNFGQTSTNEQKTAGTSTTTGQQTGTSSTSGFNFHI